MLGSLPVNEKNLTMYQNWYICLDPYTFELEYDTIRLIMEESIGKLLYGNIKN